MILMVGMAGVAHANNFSFTGHFTQDDNVQLFHFVVGATSNVTLRSWGYAGGTNAAGTLIARGGFDTILALFDSTGALIDSNDDGFDVNIGCLVPADSVSGACYDSLLTSSLSAGTYTVAVMEYNNFANGPNLSDGFQQDGQGNFTGSLTGHPGGSFWDVTGDQRDNHWAFDILDVQGATTVPEPSTLLLLLPGLTGLAAFLRTGKSRL